MAAPTIEFEAVVGANQINRLLNELRTGAEGAAAAINNALGGTVKKKIVFEEQVDINGVKKLVAVEKERLTVADQIINRQATLDRVQRNSLTSLRQQFNTLKQQRDGVVKYKEYIDDIGKSIKVQNAEWTVLNSKLSTVGRQLEIAEASGFWDKVKATTRSQGIIDISNGLVQITQGLQAASIVVGQFLGSINQVIDTAAQLQSFALSFKAIGAGAAGATQGLQDTSKIALGLGVDINTVQEGFKQLSPVVLNTGGTITDVSKITETLSSRFAAFGITGDRARRVMAGIIQAFAKGKLQAEELTQQISEADPAFKTDFAKALFAAKGSLGDLGKEIDGSVANLEKLIKQSKITADVLLKVLPGLSKSSLLFGKLGNSGASAIEALQRGTVTIDQVRNNLKNLNQLSLRNLAESAKPLINAFLGIQATVTDFLSRLSQTGAINTFANIATNAVNALTRLADIFFVLIEGAVKIVDVLSPVINVISSIPGVTELAGLAIIGKLLGPFDLLGSRINKTKIAWAGFRQGFVESFAVPQKIVKEVSGQINELRAVISKPTSAIAVGSQDAPKEIAKSANKAIDNVTTFGATASTQIQQQINKTNTAIDKARQRLRESTQTNIKQTVDTSAQDVLITRIAEARTELQRLGSTGNASFSALNNYISNGSINTEELKKAVQSAMVKVEQLSGIRLLGNLDLENFDRLESLNTNLLRKELDLSTQTVNNFLSALNSGDIDKALSSLTKRGPEESAKSYERRVQAIAQGAFRSINTIQKALIARGEEVNIIPPNQSDKIKQINNQITILEAELNKLKSAAADTAPSGTFSEREIKRQERLKAAIAASRQQIRALEAEQAGIRQTTTTARREVIGFQPLSESRIGQAATDYTKTQTQEIIKQQLDSNKKLSNIEKKRKIIINSLSAIEGERVKVNKQFNLNIQPEEYATDRVTRLTTALSKLNENRGKLINQARIFATSQTDINKILKEGSDATASFEQRQKALQTSFGILSLAAKNNADETERAQKRLDDLSTKRERLASRAVSTGQTRRSLSNLDEKIAEATAKLNQLQNEGIQLGGALDKARTAIDSNGRTADTTNAKFSRLAGTLKIGVGGAFNVVRGGLGALANGFKGLLGLIDPLTALFLAAGLATRLYNDGTREATEAAKQYKDQIALLNAAIADISPGKQQEQQTTALERAWLSLANTTGKLGNVIGSTFEGIAKKFEGVAGGLRKSGDLVTDRFVNIAGSISLVAGSVAAFAGIGALFGGVGAPVGAAIGLIVGLVAAISLGGTEAERSLDQLKAKLKEIDSGAQITTTTANALAIKLEEIGKIKPKDITVDEINKIKSGLELLRNTAAKTEQELAGLRGIRSNNVSKINKNIQNITSKTGELEEAQKNLSIVESNPWKYGGAAALDYEEKIGKLKQEISSLKDENNNLFKANKNLDGSIKGLNNSLYDQESAAKRAEEAARQFNQTLVKSANTISELEAAIQFLQEENKGLQFTNPKDRAELDANLEKIKRLQETLEFVSKTKYEIDLEVRGLNTSIAQAQNRINLEPGTERDTVNTILEISKSVADASNEFERKAANYRSLVKEGSSYQKIGSEQLQISGLKFLDATRKAAADLADAGRDLIDKLKDAQGSLSNLKLSKPEFFSPQELAANAADINKKYEETVARIGFRPLLKAGSEQEVLAQKQAFVETRDQADKFNESIVQINKSLTGINNLLAKIVGKEQALTRSVGGINGLLSGSSSLLESALGSMDGLANTGKRVGDIVGTIAAGGEEFVLYFDNATGQIEQVTAAQFKALEASDKLKKSAKDVGTNFATGAKTASDQLKSLGSDSSKIAGEISAGGKTITLDQNQFPATYNSINQSAIERLKTEQGIADSTNDQVANFRKILDLLKQTSGKSKATNGTRPEGSFVFFPSTMAAGESDTSRMRALASKVGGDYNKMLAEVISTSGEGLGFMPEAQLSSIQSDIQDYTTAVGAAKIAQDQFTAAQNAYNAAAAAGSTDLTSLAINLENAKDALNAANFVVTGSTTAYTQAINAAKQFGITLDTIPSIGEAVGTNGTELQPSLDAWDQYVKKVQEGAIKLQSQGAADQTIGIAPSAQEAATSLDGANSTSQDIASNFQGVAQSAQDAANSILNLANQEIPITVRQIPARWAGGSVVGGQVYQVNELGKEGFLSASGKLSQINAAPYATWKAPGAGAVIPAHIWSEITAPNGNISARNPSTSISGGNAMQRIASTLRTVMAGNNGNDIKQSIDRLANVQASQAIQLGKLSNAVNRFNEKDWNVKVDVTPRDNNGYIGMINRAL
jgi:DNA repair exonuclease SbcCD ATPase subunit